MKDKKFPKVRHFDIVESVDDEVKHLLKKHKIIHSAMITRTTITGQPTAYQSLRRLTDQGILIDKGIATIKVKGETQRRRVRLYERV